MIINEYGAVILTSDEIFENFYSGKLSSLENFFVSDIDAEKFNKSKNINKDSFEKLKVFQPPQESVEIFDKSNQSKWFMPDEYKKFGMEDWLYSKCKTEEEKDRVNLELKLFAQHGMTDLLFYLKYLVDTMRENNIVWGVGRGSSVASFVLFLIGVHKVNSIKYDLDIHEFLK